MAYFDSPKNKALWEKELASLRKEREARANGKSASVQAQKAAQTRQLNEEKDFRRERTSYKKLLAEEAESIKAKRVAGRERVTQKVAPSISKSHDKEMAM